MTDQRWLGYALLAAAMAALVAVLGKSGMKDVDATLATTVRSVVMTTALLFVCLFMSETSGLETISSKSMTLISLSGLAGAASWLFYFKALKVGTVHQVAPIDKLGMPLAVILAVVFLHERPSALNWTGIALIVVGAILASTVPR